MSKSNTNKVYTIGCMPRGCLFLVAMAVLTGGIVFFSKKSPVKNDTMANETRAIVPDTLKIGSYQKTYVPLLRQFQNQK